MTEEQLLKRLDLLGFGLYGHAPAVLHDGRLWRPAVSLAESARHGVICARGFHEAYPKGTPDDHDIMLLSLGYAGIRALQTRELAGDFVGRTAFEVFITGGCELDVTLLVREARSLPPFKNPMVAELTCADGFTWSMRKTEGEGDAATERHWGGLEGAGVTACHAAALAFAELLQGEAGRFVGRSSPMHLVQLFWDLVARYWWDDVAPYMDPVADAALG